MRSHAMRYPTPAHTYQFDATLGSDTNTGAADHPRQTIAHANALALKPGDRVLLNRGETWSGTHLLPSASGTPARPITFGAYGAGALPVITGGAGKDCISSNGKNYLTFENLDANGNDSAIYGFNVSGHHNLLVGCVGRQGTLNGIIGWGLPTAIHHTTLLNCIAHDNGESGIHFGAEANPGPAYGLIRGCSSYANGTSDALHHGVYLKFGMGWVVEHNALYDNFAGGIKDSNANADYQSGNVYDGNNIYGNYVGLFVSGQGTTFRNNLFHGNDDNCIHLLNDSDYAANNNLFYHNTIQTAYCGIRWIVAPTSTRGVNNVFRNNVIYAPGHNSISMPGSAALVTTYNTFDYNRYFNNGGANDALMQGWIRLVDWQGYTGSRDAHTGITDPVFVNAASDWHLQVTSPCIAAGETGLGVLTDYDSAPRGAAFDQGCYEYVA